MSSNPLCGQNRCTRPLGSGLAIVVWVRSSTISPQALHSFRSPIKILVAQSPLLALYWALTAKSRSGNWKCQLTILQLAWVGAVHKSPNSLNQIENIKVKSTQRDKRSVEKLWGKNVVHLWKKGITKRNNHYRQEEMIRESNKSV